MRLKRLTLAILAATALNGCGDKKSSQGSTLQQFTPTLKSTNNSWLACLDFNRNWTCDDGDQSHWLESTGETGLSLQHYYTLLEKRDHNNQRTQLLLSTDSVVTAASTQKVILDLQGETQSTALIEEDELKENFIKAIDSGYLPIAALSAVSLAMDQQLDTAKPQNQMLGHEVLSQWYSTDPSDTRRQLSVQGEVVLNNTDSNRLYLFDGSATDINHREMDLIPVDESLLAKTSAWQRQALAWVRKGLDVTIDTVSAATAINGEISTGSPVLLTPGQGISAAHLINGGKEALVLMNMLDERYTESICATPSSISEGVFRVPLNTRASYQHLEPLSTCVHSGFTLLASNTDGQRYGAWDDKAKTLWLFANDTLKHQLKLKLEHPVQSLAMTSGGNFIVAVAIGKAVIIDVEQGKVLHTLSGPWGNVINADFTNAGRSVLIASDSNVHTLHLNTSLQVISSRTTKLSTDSGGDIKSLNVMADGDSYFALTDSTIKWMKSDGSILATQSLPHGVSVQKSVATQNQLLVLARGTQDLTFKLLRYPLSLSKLDQVDQ